MILLFLTLQSLKKWLEEEYSEKYEVNPSVQFQFPESSDKVELDIPEVEGYTISPGVHPTEVK